ncbi:MAG TPA: glycosyltransferase, partial [Sulfurovum sp.]
PSSVDKAYLETGEVIWLGHRDDVLLLTAMSDIYVLPSYREGVPRTLLEAASMGKPIITTDTVGCREVVVNGENGYLIPVKDEISLAEKIEYLANDPNKRKIMGENGRMKAIKEFDIKNVVDEYMKLYYKFQGNK